MLTGQFADKPTGTLVNVIDKPTSDRSICSCKLK